jgi:hypothetical protein
MHNIIQLYRASSISEPANYGEFKEVCGKTYLFGKKEAGQVIFSIIKLNRNIKVSWEENWKTCCAIGMRPVVFDTEEELRCVMQEIAS